MDQAAPAWADTQKKPLVAAEQLRTDIAEARQRWDSLKAKLDVKHLVFLDETWTKTNMTRQRGRAPAGQRLLGRVPWAHWRTTTFVAGLRHDRVVAPIVLDRAMNGVAFRAYIEQSLAPTLGPGDIVRLCPSRACSGQSRGAARRLEGRLGSFDKPSLSFEYHRATNMNPGKPVGQANDQASDR